MQNRVFKIILKVGFVKNIKGEKKRFYGTIGVGSVHSGL